MAHLLAAARHVVVRAGVQGAVTLGRQAVRHCGACSSGGEWLDPSQTPAKPHVIDRLGLFSPGTVHRSTDLFEGMQALLNTFHARTLTSGEESFAARGFKLGEPMPSSGSPYDPRHLGHGVFAHVQHEQSIPSPTGGAPAHALRQMQRFSYSFSNSMSQQDKAKGIKATQTLFQASESEASQFIDFLATLDQQFRKDNGISQFTEVRFTINGLTQRVSGGPVQQGSLLLERHKDGKGVNATVLVREPDTLNPPLHTVVLTPDEGGAVEHTTGIVVFNGVEHEVVAGRDLKEGEVALSATVAIGIEVVDGRGGYRAY